MPLVDFRDASCEGACIDGDPNAVRHCVQGRVGRCITQSEVVDNDVHENDLILARSVRLGCSDELDAWKDGLR